MNEQEKAVMLQAVRMVTQATAFVGVGKMSSALILEDGKYAVLRHDDGSMEALRNGEPWRDLTGDKLVGALCSRIDELTAPDPVPKTPPVRLTISDAAERYTVPAATYEEMKIAAAPKDVIGRKITQWVDSMAPAVLLSNEQPPALSERAVPDDFISHKGSWREALLIAQKGAINDRAVSDADYWQHEIAAFDRAYAELTK